MQRDLPGRGRRTRPSILLVVATGLICFGAPATASEAASPEALALLNDDLKRVWAHLRPALTEELSKMLCAELEQLEYRRGPASLRVNDADCQLSVEPPPGMTELATDRLAARAPLVGVWSAEVRLEILLQLRLRSRSLQKRLRVALELDLSAGCAVDVDDTDATLPRVERIEHPQVSLRVRLRSPRRSVDGWLERAGFLLEPLISWAIERAIDRLEPTLRSLEGIPGPVPGAGTPPYEESGDAVPLWEIVRRVDEKIRRDHMPHGTLLRAIMDRPARDSWQVAYAPSGPGNAGRTVAWGDGGDSAIWSGHYLASQAFRHAVTGEPAALGGID
ncbi:hypothetical protein ACFL59_11320 [Planctomycetota bacterium]